MTDLPVWAVMPDILAALKSGRNVVLTAPTGSGKTTQVPQAILDNGSITRGSRIYAVEPRRVACMTAARRVAEERQTIVGQEVGYIVRFDNHSSRETRICFLTDGMFLHFLEKSAEFSQAGVVVFDEFHERRLLSDLALALIRQAQRRRRSLGIVVMSATIETGRVASYLDAVIIEAHGRSYPVEIRYRDERPPERLLPQTISDEVVHLHFTAPRGAGDVLVFLPGKEEIRKAQEALEEKDVRGIVPVQLYGEMPLRLQEVAFGPTGGRKVVLATNVAETSVTIPGVSMVIDSGLERQDFYSHEFDTDALTVRPISRASADQRAGRAGRESPGICVRLWSERDHAALERASAPEIQRAELGLLVLTLRGVGINDVASFNFLEAPDRDRLATAETLLFRLGALDAEGVLTKIGWKMLRLPFSPRLARMVVEAERSGCLKEVVTIAAMLGGRPIFFRPPREETLARERHQAFATDDASDFTTLLEIERQFRVQKAHAEAWCAENYLNFDTMLEALNVRRHTAFQLIVNGDATWNDMRADPAIVQRCIATGLVDRVAQQIVGREYRMATGAYARLGWASVVNGPFIAAASVKSIENGADERITALLNFVLRVNPELLEQLAPHLWKRYPSIAEYFPALHTARVREDRYYLTLFMGTSEERLVDWNEAWRIEQDVAARAASLGCQRVLVVQPKRPGMPHFTVVDGRKIPVATKEAGWCWASVEHGAHGVAVTTHWRIFDIPQPPSPEQQTLTERLEHATHIAARIMRGSK